MKKILIIYSGFDPNGSTATLAKFLSNGVKKAGLHPILKHSDKVTVNDVSKASGFLLGSGDYNGNPEPSMITFFDNTLKAGNLEQLKNIQTSPFGVFCTSAGYATGAQEVMNAMARAMMTFGGIYVGGSSWREGQGYAAMVVDSKDGSWTWKDGDPSKYACEYGFRVANMASFLSDQYEKNAEGKSKCEAFKPKTSNGGKVDTAKVIMYVSLVFALLLFGVGLYRSNGSIKILSLGLVIASVVFLIYGFVCTGPTTGSKPGPKPQPSLKCSSTSDCPNTTLFSCSNNTCVLKDPKFKTNITNYLDSIYPSTLKLSNMLTDVELYNFFITLGYYWLSFNSPDAKEILKTLDDKFPANIACGGFYVLPASDDVTACSSQPHTAGDSNWPCTDGTKTCKNPCCEPGSLSIPPVMDQLYFCDYITKSTEVLRNGYDPKDTLNKSVLYDPVYLYHTQKLSNKTPLQSLCLIKDGVDDSGKKLSYKVCDGSKTYDFTTVGPGFSSNSLVGCVRNKGVSGHATDTFYYMAQGTGNQLELGVTARTLNKVHGTLVLIRRVGELDFGSLTTYKFSPTYTTTKQTVELSDGTLTNSFVLTPQLLLLECLMRENTKISFQNPTAQNGFGTDAANKIAPGATWPFTDIAPQSSPQQSFVGLLEWYFAYKKVTLPDTSNYNNNWSSWSKQAVATLGMFFDAVSVPEFDSWELNYIMNRMANSSAYDIIIYALMGAKHVEITGTGDTETPGPKDTKGNPFQGVTNSEGKHIETFGCAIQPGGGSGWAYELIDYRLNLGHAKGDPKIWTMYANKYIKVGNPLVASTLKPCTPRYCTDTDQAACEPGDSDPTQADWLVLTCQAPLAPVKTKYKCDSGTCSLDPHGTYNDLTSCQSACKSPSIKKCKDISDGAQHNYCSGWCGKSGIWSCGANTMDNGQQCDCSGCGSCP